MNHVVKTNIVLLLTALLIAGCSSTPEQSNDQWNSAETQKSKAKQAQDELSSEMDKKQ